MSYPGYSARGPATATSTVTSRVATCPCGVLWPHAHGPDSMTLPSILFILPNTTTLSAITLARRKRIIVALKHLPRCHGDRVPSYTPPRSEVGGARDGRANRQTPRNLGLEYPAALRISRHEPCSRTLHRSVDCSQSAAVTRPPLVILITCNPETGVGTQCARLDSLSLV